MTDLIKRLEEAEEGSADLDREVERALGVIPMGVREDGTWGQKRRPWTTSLDAVVALEKQVLPGLYMWKVEFDDEPTNTPASAKVYAKRDGQSSAHTPALALCIAILKATDTGRE